MSVGMWVQGEDFYGRAAELDALFAILARDSASLLAPRRVGKTSLMHRAARDASARGWKAVFVDVQGASDEMGFLARLIAALHDAGHPAERDWGRWLEGRVKALQTGTERVSVTLPSAGGASLGSVELALRAVPPGTWRDLAQAVASRLIGHAQPTVILVDELPILMLKLLEAPDGKRRAADLLDWHRELRLASNAAHLRWVLGGSIGIETVASKHNLTSRFNDLAPLDLGPFTDDEAHGFLVHLAFRLGQGASFPPDVREYLIERVGQEQREEVGAFLLDVLVSDGYLVQQGRRFRFRSPLLRQYWLRRFGVEE